uniref:Uncharacterized protein n=1 Tax=Aegilops tauschii subsp. strangulata TaxID=200361 RepID=A0A453BBB5_AEGTS
MEGDIHEPDGPNGHDQHDEQDDGPLPPFPHDPERKRVEEHEDPHVEQHPEQHVPRLVREEPPCRRLAYRCPDGRDVHDEHHDGREQQRHPPHGVQVGELVIGAGVRLLGREPEVYPLPGDELERHVKHRRRVHARGPDHVELLVAAPVEQRDPRPFHLEHADHVDHRYDGDEVHDVRAERPLDVELLGEEPENGEEVVRQDEHRDDRVGRHVEVGDALQRVEPAAGHESVAVGEEHLQGAARPPEHLVEALGEVDGSRSAEGGRLHGAIHGAPPLPVHAKSGHHVLRRDVVHPPDVSAP